MILVKRIFKEFKKKKYYEFLYKYYKKELEKKIYELYFLSRYWFWIDLVYSDFDWLGFGGEFDFKDWYGGII